MEQPSTVQPEATHDDESTQHNLRTWRTPSLMILNIDQTESGANSFITESFPSCKPSAS